jgi:hypothetical protein
MTGASKINAFFERPILNSPYEYPARHWELGPDKQPTQRIVDRRRRAELQPGRGRGNRHLA